MQILFPSPASPTSTAFWARGEQLQTLEESVLKFFSLPQRRALIIALLIYNFCFQILGPQLQTNTQSFILPSSPTQALVTLNRLQYLGGKDHDSCPWLSRYELTQMSNELFLWLYDMP